MYSLKLFLKGKKRELRKYRGNEENKGKKEMRELKIKLGKRENKIYYRIIYNEKMIKKKKIIWNKVKNNKINIKIKKLRKINVLLVDNCVIENEVLLSQTGHAEDCDS